MKVTVSGTVPLVGWASKAATGAGKVVGVLVGVLVGVTGSGVCVQSVAVCVKPSSNAAVNVGLKAAVVSFVGVGVHILAVAL